MVPSVLLSVEPWTAPWGTASCETEIDGGIDVSMIGAAAPPLDGFVKFLNDRASWPLGALCCAAWPVNRWC